MLVVLVMVGSSKLPSEGFEVASSAQQAPEIANNKDTTSEEGEAVGAVHVLGWAVPSPFVSVTRYWASATRC